MLKGLLSDVHIYRVPFYILSPSVSRSHKIRIKKTPTKGFSGRSYQSIRSRQLLANSIVKITILWKTRYVNGTEYCA